MSVTTTPERVVKKWRVIVFTVAAVLFALLFLLLFGGVYGILSPWVVLDTTASPTYHAALHRWSDTQWGVLTGLLLGGCLIALLWQGQKRPLVAQFFALSLALLTLTFVPFLATDPEIYFFIVLCGLFVLAYPALRSLFSFSPRERFSSLLLGLTILTAIILAPLAIRDLGRQISGFGGAEYQDHHVWISSVQLSLLLVISGLLAATKRAGWQVLGMLTGLALLYLGIAALLLPDQPGSWGMPGGVLAVLGGLSYIAVTIVEARRTKNAAQKPASVAANSLRAQG